MKNSNTMTKREFLRLLCVGGGCAFCSSGLVSLFDDEGGVDFVPAGEDVPGKWSKEAWFCVEKDGFVQCLKCPHECALAPGDVGRCRSRVNYNGKVYSIAYGNPCAVHVDPIEKKPLFHFLPSTRSFSIAVAGCNLRCLNCQNWEISQSSPRETKNFDLMPGKVVEGAIENGCASIAYTYSEPTTFYEYAFDTATIAHTRNLRNVWKSCGYINEIPLRKLCRVIDAANIDLKSFDEKVYRELNEANLAPILNTLKVLKEENVWLEITNLVIPTWTDSMEMIRRMCDWLCVNGLQDSPLHFSRFVPLYKLTQLPVTPVSTLEAARKVAVDSGMHYVYIGNVPGHEAENTYCHNCHKLLVERKGYVVMKMEVSSGKCPWCGTAVPGKWK
ncbi:MAG: AmmeMemoRadiSam system radical SAM enzyme [Bacteroidota bacterium]